MVRRFLISTSILICLMAPLQAKLEVNTLKLTNGLQIILSPIEDISATAVLFYHRNGTRDDPPEIRGASYLYQHLMRLGTQNLEPYDRLMLVKKNGGVVVERVNYDRSLFYQIIPNDLINNALWLESERILSLKLDDRAINLQKDKISKRILRLMKGSPHYRAVEWAKSKIFEGTAYQIPVYGDPEKITNFDNRQIKKIYGRFRNLSDAILVIVGKYDLIELTQFIDKHFPPSLPKGESKNRKYRTISPRTQVAFKNWLIEDLPQHFFLYGYRAPSKLSDDYFTFEFLRYYLVDERISILEKVLKRMNNLDVEISYEYTDHIEANALVIKVSSPDRVALEKAKYILNRQIQTLMNLRQPATEIRVVKSLMEIDFAKNVAQLESRSIMLAETLHLSGTPDLEETHLKKIRKITATDIIRVSKKYLNRNNLVNLNVYRK